MFLSIFSGLLPGKILVRPLGEKTLWPANKAATATYTQPRKLVTN